jgi:protocatechuate 3,4-dioxygenase beta subunit
MTADDAPIGRLLSRREALELLGAGALWLTGNTLNPGWAAANTHPCVVRPEQTEGPYFVDEDLNRSDIRPDPADGEVMPGTPLALTLLISRVGDGICQPLPGARVDLWHCDALGIYSGVQDSRFNTVGKKFLRGYQTTDKEGEARFVTVYPGWYYGRTVHIHFKIRTDPAARQGFEFVSQLYFDDALTDRIHSVEPYTARGQGRVRNRNDGIFRRSGDQLMLKPVESVEGYAALFAIGLQIP